MDQHMELDLPLAGIRIAEAVEGPLSTITRYLAELGASVFRADLAGETGAIAQLVQNRGKLPVGNDARDLASVVQALEPHVLVTGPDTAIDLAGLRSARPALVTMVVSDFGTDTSLSGWAATDAVLHALSGELSRSGIRGRAPLLPPGALAYECAAAQGAFVLASALYHAVRTGQGQHIDFSALDGAVQALDPGFGMGGSATMGRPASQLSRDRPPPGFQYPILRCADGYARICLLAKRQWQGMFRWMGSPPAFASPEFEKVVARYKSPDLLPAIATFFAGRSRAELETEGQQFGVPIAAVQTLEECVSSDHMRETMAVAPQLLPDGSTRLLPNPALRIDGQRVGPADDRAISLVWPAPSEPGERPFEGLRVLDLGVIVVGGEQGRLLADGGADVVKVESRAYPDGNRQSHLSYGLSVSFAAGHRNKRSLGLNLRDPAGKALFLRLVERADVVLSNFKPGTLAALGLDNATLQSANPRIILADSSAFGATGPWSGRMGYGPLVRAATGLTLAWRYPDDEDGYSDSVTIYPDHVSARVGALGVVALLIRRLRTGRGGSASVSQAEVMLSQFAADIADAGPDRRFGDPRDWPRNAYRTQGDDDWCVVDVRGTADWEKLAELIGFPTANPLWTAAQRLSARTRIDAAIEGWMANRSAEQAMEELQQAGVPGARMLRVADLPSFAYFKERHFFRAETHPYLEEGIVAERRSTSGNHVAEAPHGPAPLAGEHSAEVVQDWLGQSEQIDMLFESGVLEPTDPDTLQAARAATTPARNSQ